MRSTRIAISAALVGALALPIASASVATAAPASAPSSAAATQSCDQLGPWVIGTKAVNIRSKASAKSTSVGILYRGHKFTVHKSSGNWHYITDKTTGVKGWVSGTYLYRDVRMCLH
ncbi:SH3 domain-containing protein [Streptomyces meridianus]|uniref:SH3 domain-containing protein n=1 Tax=Streptomyces meridianus TaxID=2938945 RepID=A0ABT0XB10_9ACTN|nr:SH3 domain-containing protein [Streptomyces meridianus]MCM2579701.1 SH3 domain-containing protein [Streptomyces meridianus]